MGIKTWDGLTFSSVKTLDTVTNANIATINKIPNLGNQFISSWKTDNAGTSTNVQITVPTSSTGSYDCLVDWGDSTTSSITTYNDAAWTHTYSGSGTYTVTIEGVFHGIVFNNGGDRLKLLTISQWGPAFRLGTTQTSYLQGCANLTISATDTLNLRGTTNMANAFRSCTSITTIPNINSWDWSGVTTISGAFLGNTSFNQALSFNSTACTNFANAFQTCTALNSAMSFSMASATNCNSMFNGCTIFNSAIPTVPSSVTNMSFVFNACPAFNQAITSITSSGCTNFSSMFAGCTAFNQSISTLSTAAGTLLLNMFQNCAAFNQAVTNLVTANCTDCSVLFSGCTVFNQAVSSFVTTNVTNMSTMFRLCPAFNQAVSAFNTAKVTNMTSMFNGCTVFNQDVSGWSIAALTNATTMFTSSAFAIANYNLLLDSAAGWPSQGTINNNVTFSAGSAHYSGANAIAGRAVLVTGHTWTVTDGGTP